MDINHHQLAVQISSISSGTRELCSRVIRKLFGEKIELNLKAVVIFTTDLDYLEKDFVVCLDTLKQIEALSFPFLLPTIEPPCKSCVTTSTDGR